MASRVVPERVPVRSSNFELLRCVLMLCIIGFHFAVHSGFPDSLGHPGADLWIRFLEQGGKIGVNGFVLLSGYFLSAQETYFNFQKFVSKFAKIFVQVICYTLLLTGIYFCLPGKNFEFAVMYKSIFPAASYHPWYAIAYLILYLLSPYLNLFLHQLQKTQFQVLLCVLFFMFSVWPTFQRVNPKALPSDLTWFVCLYLLAGYLRKYPAQWTTYSWRSLLVTGLCWLWLMFNRVLWENLPLIKKIPVKALMIPVNLHPQHTVPTVLAALGLFLFFKNLKNFKNYKIINQMGSTIFGIYLFHDFVLMRPVLWVDLFHNLELSQKAPQMILFHSLWVIFLVFLMGFCLDLFRQKLFFFISKIIKIIKIIKNK